MKRFFYSLYKYKAFAVFIVLELISITLFATHKSGKYSFLGTNNYLIGSIYGFISEIRDYHSLKKENEELLQENTLLRKKFLHEGDAPDASPPAVVPAHYDLIPAKVINNSIANTKNYLTLNKGAVHGVTPGMGVMCSEGLVGKVKAVSERFATVISLLHTDMLVSAKLSQSGVMGTVQWPGNDPFCAQLLYVPRHIIIEPGEAVVTSGYNATFSSGVLIGHVKHVALRQEAPFYDIELRISTDFSALHYVYIVKNTFRQEQNVLEQYTKDFYD
jgi:rod shape-determining protein MreC